MGLEAATYIPQLVASNPVGATDPKAQGDDHLRLLKLVLQNQFPNIGNNAVTVTAAQINLACDPLTRFAVPAKKIGTAANADGVAATAMRSDATIQLDAALPYTWTAINTFQALLRASFANACIRLTGNGALDTKVWDFVALDASGTFAGRHLNDAEGASANWITVTPTGSGANVAAVNFPSGVLQHAGIAVPDLNTNAVWTGTHQFNNGITSAAAVARIVWTETDAPTDEKSWEWRADGSKFTLYTDVDSGGASGTVLQISRAGAVVGIANFVSATLQYGGIEVGYRNIPSAAGVFAAGKCNLLSAGATLNTTDMAQDRVLSIYNDSAAAITLTQGAGVTLRLGGTTTTGNRTIAPRGFCSIWCRSATEAIATGHVS